MSRPLTLGQEIQRELKGRFPLAKRKQFAQSCYRVTQHYSLFSVTRQLLRLERNRLGRLHKAVNAYLAGTGTHVVLPEVHQLRAALLAANGYGTVSKSDPFTVWGTLAVNYFEILGQAPTKTTTGPFYRVVRIILRHIDGHERQFPTRIVAAAVLHLRGVLRHQV